MTAERSASTAETTAIGIASACDPADAAEVDGGEDERRSRTASGVTGIPGRYHCVMADAERMRGQPAGRDPAPPVTDARQVREHRAVGAEGLGAGRRDAADAVRPHQDQLDPAGIATQLRSRPTISSGTAALPWLTIRAPIRKRLWLLPPIASAVVPTQPRVRGCSTAFLSVARGPPGNRAAAAR